MAVQQTVYMNMFCKYWSCPGSESDYRWKRHGWSMLHMYSFSAWRGQLTILSWLTLPLISLTLSSCYTIITAEWPTLADLLGPIGHASIAMIKLKTKYITKKTTWLEQSRWSCMTCMWSKDLCKQLVTGCEAVKLANCVLGKKQQMVYCGHKGPTLVKK